MAVSTRDAEPQVVAKSSCTTGPVTLRLEVNTRTRSVTAALKTAFYLRFIGECAVPHLMRGAKIVVAAHGGTGTAAACSSAIFGLRVLSIAGNRIDMGHSEAGCGRS